jgi:hypothetical protein
MEETAPAIWRRGRPESTGWWCSRFQHPERIAESIDQPLRQPRTKQTRAKHQAAFRALEEEPPASHP